MPLSDESVVDYVRTSLNYDGALDVDTPLFSTGGLDSVAMMNLIGYVETAGGLQVRAEDVTLENFDTAARIARFVAGQS